MHRDSRLNRSLIVFVMAIVALPALAQDGPYWNTLPLPGPLVTPPNNTGFQVVAFGTNCTIRTATDVYMYSGILRSWASIPLSPSAVLYPRFNEHVIVRDGTTVHAWSTHTGAVTSITVSPTAVVNTGVDGSSWTASVVDGNTVWGYAAFNGNWASIATATTNPAVTHSNHIFVVQDISAVYAFSAYFGSFEAAPASTVSVVQQSVAVTIGPGDQVYGFSAYDNVWSSTNFPGASTATVRHWATWALLQAGPNVLGYSGDSAKFTTYAGTTPVATSFKIAPEAAIFQDGALAVGYAPATGAFATQLMTSALPILFPAENRFGCYCVVIDGPDVYAFSGIFGTFTPAINGSFTLSYSDATAFAASTTAGTSWVYSGIKHQWYAIPTAFTSSTILYNGLVVATPGGYLGFSSRTGAFTPVAAGPTTPVVHGSLFSALDGPNALIFDDVVDRWVSVAGSGPLQANAWRLTEILHDGFTAWGFSLFTNEVDAVPISGTVQEFRANSEIGYVLTSTHLHVYTSFGTFTPLFRFPEHARHQPRGAPMRLFQTAPPGSTVDTFVSDAPLYQPFPPFGTIRIDYLSPALFSVPLGTVPASGVLDVSVIVPATPAFNGLQLRLQNVITPPVGTPWITSAVAPVFL